MPPRAKISSKLRSAPKDAAVTWRDGVHISNTAIWCDARRARDICFVSVAGAVGRSKHGQLIASSETLALLDQSQASEGSRLAVPYAQPFTLGTQRLELFRSGHGIGAASLLVKLDDKALVFAGAINPQGSALGGALDHRRADVLILRASYGERSFSFGDPAGALSQLHDHCSAIVARGGVALVLVTSTTKAMDLAVHLAQMSLPLKLHRSYHDALRRVRELRAEMPDAPRFVAGNREAQVVLWPVQSRERIDTTALPAGSAVLLVSGRACQARALSAVGASIGIPLSDQADHDALVSYIQDSGAKQVYLTESADLGRDLAERLPAIDIKALGAPTQLQLF